MNDFTIGYRWCMDMTSVRNSAIIHACTVQLLGSVKYDYDDNYDAVVMMLSVYVAF